MDSLFRVQMTYTGTIRDSDARLSNVHCARSRADFWYPVVSSGFEESITLSFEFALWEEVEICVSPWPWDKDWGAGVQQWEFFTVV